MLYRDSWIEINLDHLKENVALINKKIGKNLIAVIKANGYGCGDATIAQAVLEAGAKMLAVSSLDEALSLRNEGIHAEILILGYVNPIFAPLLRQHDLTTTVVCEEWANEFVRQDCAGCKVHLKADTGMNRIGIKEPEAMQRVIALLKQHQVQVEGMFTHLACAEETDDRANREQLERFIKFKEAIKTDLAWLHICNSDGAMRLDETIGNAARCGLAMFGINEFAPFSLKPVMALKSRVVCVKKIQAHESVGYGWTYQASQEEWIATIPIGYADGWNRKNQGRMALVKGRPCEFVGRICMDQAMLRVFEGVEVGDEVELFGPNLPIAQVAEELKTIPYEVMTSLTDRLAKVYYSGGVAIKTVNPRFDRHFQ